VQEEGDDASHELAPWEDQLQCVNAASVMQLCARCAKVGYALALGNASYKMRQPAASEEELEDEDASEAVHVLDELCAIEGKEEVPLPTPLPPPQPPPPPPPQCWWLSLERLVFCSRNLERVVYSQVQAVLHIAVWSNCYVGLWQSGVCQLHAHQ
jgi:hypothetical protein